MRGVIVEIAALIIFLLAVLSFSGCCASRATLYNDLGMEAARFGMWHEATIRFEQAVALRPNDGALHNNLAVAYEAQGNRKDAEAEYTKAVQMSPGLRAAHDNFQSFANNMVQPPQQGKVQDEQD